MLNFVGYLLGMLAHVTFMWANWVQGRPPAERRAAWGRYWREYLGLNVSSAVCAVVAYPLWDSGWISHVLPSTSFMGYSLPAFPLTPGTSAMAGLILDMFARTSAMMLQRFLRRRAAADAAREDDGAAARGGPPVTVHGALVRDAAADDVPVAPAGAPKPRRRRKRSTPGAPARRVGRAQRTKRKRAK